MVTPTERAHPSSVAGRPWVVPDRALRRRSSGPQRRPAGADADRHQRAGRPIYAEQHGYGGDVIVVVGQVHGNECAPQLVTEAVRQHGWTGTTVWLIPTLNPDGYANHTRTNANGVDLNRDGHAMSQPESAALRDFVANVGATLVVHVHSPSNFAGYYGGGRARDLAAAYTANVGISFRGQIANHPFLWLGHAGQTVLVELPAIADHDAAGRRTTGRRRRSTMCGG